MLVPLFCPLPLFHLKNRQPFLSYIGQARELEHHRKKLFEMLTCNDIYLLTPAFIWQSDQANVWLYRCLRHLEKTSHLPFYHLVSTGVWGQVETIFTHVQGFQFHFEDLRCFQNAPDLQVFYLLVLYPDTPGVSDWGVAAWPSPDCSPKIKQRKRFKNFTGHWVTFSVLLTILSFFQQCEKVRAAFCYVNETWEAYIKKHLVHTGYLWEVAIFKYL